MKPYHKESFANSAADEKGEKMTKTTTIRRAENSVPRKRSAIRRERKSPKSKKKKISI